MLHRVADLFLSLLPARYRRNHQLDPIGGTAQSGILEFLAAFLAYGTLFFRYLESYGALSGAAMASDKAGGQELHALAFGLGVLGWLAFSLTPGPLLAIYFMLEGAVRALSGFVTHEPLASLPFWLVGVAHGVLDRRRAQLRLAPLAPDLVELAPPGEKWDLRVTSVRNKPEWQSLVQVEYGGSYYRITRIVEDLVDGTSRFRYELKKATPTEAYRGIVHYNPFEYWKGEGKT